jgi:hypothetical protein
MLIAFLFLGLGSITPAASFSTNNANSSLPLRGGPGLVYAGNYGVPPLNASSPQPEPLRFNAGQIATFAQEQIDGIIASKAFEGNCSKCIAALEVVKFLALAFPEQVPTVLQNTCKKYRFANNQTCDMRYSSTVLGPYINENFTY